MNKLQHETNCEALAPPIDGDCTCGLVYRERIATLEAQVKRLSVPVRDEEIMAMWENIYFDPTTTGALRRAAGYIDYLLAARATAPAGTEVGDRDQHQEHAQEEKL